MRVFLDDDRFPQQVYEYTKNKIYKEEWIIVRDFNEFKAVIQFSDVYITHISFDHDLGEDKAKKLVAEGISKRKARAQKKLAKSGMDCAKWYIEYLQEEKINDLPNILVHSQNPVGKENIIKLFESYEKVLKKS